MLVVMNKFQIIIVGSGPAGIATALHLQKLAPGLAGQTLVLEKARHPRPKLCGGGLTVDAEVLLHKMDLDVSKIPSIEVETAHLDFKGKGLRFKQLSGRTLRMVRRDEFDAWLVSEARQRGLQIREGVKVNSLQAGI